MHTTHIDIPLKNRQSLIKLLNGLLASATDLVIQAKVAHWNIRGMHFITLHELFDKVHETADKGADELAERIGQLGGITEANIQSAAKATNLPVFKNTLSKDKEVITALVKSMAQFTNDCRKGVDAADKLGDTITADILTGISRETDKMLWFVESHLN